MAGNPGVALSWEMEKQTPAIPGSGFLHGYILLCQERGLPRASALRASLKHSKCASWRKTVQMFPSVKWRPADSHTGLPH